ncbi:MAG: hypothetical protein MUF18_07715 [Fimbriiglobus sp.]|nr:hypothetical protein [Fimbriiglobus sp.]
MRSILAVAVLAAAGAAASAEELKDITLPTRYGITPSPEFYPQGTAKETLATAAKLIEKGRYAYILAYVIDPAFVDAQVAARARQLTPAVEKRLGERRAEQRRGLTADTRPEDVVPTDPVGFAEKVQAEAERLAFDGLVKALQENLAEFPENVTQLAAISRDGVIAESGPAATAEAKAVPNKKVFLKQLDVVASKESRVVIEGRLTTRQDPTTIQRWFLEDRQADTEKADKPKVEK